eukprot:jgi/Chlat1/2360/Chrsp17S02631
MPHNGHETVSDGVSRFTGQQLQNNSAPNTGAVNIAPSTSARPVGGTRDPRPRPGVTTLLCRILCEHDVRSIARQIQSLLQESFDLVCLSEDTYSDTDPPCEHFTLGSRDGQISQEVLVDAWQLDCTEQKSNVRRILIECTSGVAPRPSQAVQLLEEQLGNFAFTSTVLEHGNMEKQLADGQVLHITTGTGPAERLAEPASVSTRFVLQDGGGASTSDAAVICRCIVTYANPVLGLYGPNIQLLELGRAFQGYHARCLVTAVEQWVLDNFWPNEKFLNLAVSNVLDEHAFWQRLGYELEEPPFGDSGEKRLVRPKACSCNNCVDCWLSPRLAARLAHFASQSAQSLQVPDQQHVSYWMARTLAVDQRHVTDFFSRGGRVELALSYVLDQAQRLQDSDLPGHVLRLSGGESGGNNGGQGASGEEDAESARAIELLPQCANDDSFEVARFRLLGYVRRVQSDDEEGDDMEDLDNIW